MHSLFAGEFLRWPVDGIGMNERPRTPVRAGGALALEVAPCQRQG